ncbi:MAG: phosphatase PAP2 family protein, partial [Candidatus Dojkabacteria bacterium]|nr:phosphatase PAP2 family protein [Candidatus Dojkabacteria bacterium]
TTVLTVVIARYLPYIGLIISSVFFYIVMPILLYFYLYKKGLITDEKFDFNIRKREERPLYLFLIALGFITNFILISMYNIPQVKEVTLFFSLAFLVFAIVTIFWKISGHMTQTVITILILAYVFADIRIYILLAGYLICVPLVGYSRIKLKHHNIWQVIAGTLVTTAIGILVFTII